MAHSDPMGQGRSTVALAYTDADNHRKGDPAGKGRRTGEPPKNATDRDSGPSADKSSQGRRHRSPTDSDSGRYCDAVGQGRGTSSKP